MKKIAVTTRSQLRIFFSKDTQLYIFMFSKRKKQFWNSNEHILSYIFFGVYEVRWRHKTVWVWHIAKLLPLLHFTFTFMHLADAFIQSDLQLHSGYTFLISTCVPWESNPQPFALLTQCSTTEPHRNTIKQPIGFSFMISCLLLLANSRLIEGRGILCLESIWFENNLSYRMSHQYAANFIT